MIVEIDFPSGLTLRVACGNWWNTRDGLHLSRITEIKTKKPEGAWLPALETPARAVMTMKIPKGSIKAIRPITD